MKPDNTLPGGEGRPEDTELREAREKAQRILALVDSSPQDKLQEAVLAASVRVYESLRELILSGPAELLEQTDPSRFLALTKLRAEWLVRGWRRFFTEHTTLPPSPKKPLEQLLPYEGMARAEKLSVAIYPWDRAKIKEVRRGLEDDGIRRVSDSQVVRMGLRSVPSNRGERMRLYLTVCEDDARRPKKSGAD